MPSELMRKDCGVEPVEVALLLMHHFHQRIEHFAFLADFVAEAVVLVALDQRQSFGVAHSSNSRDHSRIPVPDNPKLQVGKPALQVHHLASARAGLSNSSSISE